MAVPNQILQNVATYQLSGLAALQNFGPFISTANKKFKNFQDRTAQLGTTVTFDLPPRFTTTNSLVAVFQPANQRLQSLTVNNEISTSYAFTDQQFIYNVRDYMDRFGMSAVREIGAVIEANVASLAVTNTYRFYGDGVTAINSPTQLAEAMALFRNYGAVSGQAKGYLSDVAIPAIIGGIGSTTKGQSALAQYAPERNNRLVNSWELGPFADCTWYKSNLLPVHVAGSAGAGAFDLTVTATHKDANGAITSIDFTVSGNPGADANMIKQYDKFQFRDGIAGHPNMRFLTFVGHQASSNPVQFQATADAASTVVAGPATAVTVTISPPLQPTASADQNINQDVQVGMVARAMPSHRAGLITAGDPLFLAMPALPNETPYPTANAIDPMTGMSIRQYYGCQFAANTRGMVHDAIWGATLVPEYSMAVLFPV